MADTTLQAIQNKVRRLTRSPSVSQLPDADINEYVNTFLLYDMPEQLRLFALRDTFSFYTSPYVDKYPTDIESYVGVTTNQLYDFRNRYVTTHKPVYIAGLQSSWSQSREEFYGNYPLNNSIQTVDTGDGITTTFTGTIPNIGTSQGTVLLQNNILMSSIDINNEGLALIDKPVHETVTGNPTTNGNLYVPGSVPSIPPTVVDATNTINYVTGVYTITFATAPGSGQDITSQTVPQAVAKPNSILYFDNAFWVRPVPDKPYKINIEVYRLPTELLNTGDSPELKQWWQYIAYGAAKKVFEDRTDMESVGMIMSEFKTQERLALRRTIVQQTKERTATIYTNQVDFGSNNNWQWGNF